MVDAGKYDAAVEIPNIYLRQAAPREPVELVINSGGGVCIVYRLRRRQLARLALDATRMALSSSES